MIAAWLPYPLLVAGLVSLAAAALALACRRLGVPQRWVWLAALAVSVALPLDALRPPAEPPRVTLSPIASVAAEVSSVLLPPREAVWLSWDLAALLAWVVASAAVLVVLLVGQRRLRLALRDAREAVIDGTAVRLTRELGPAVIGFFRPEIVLPAWTSRLPAAERRLVVEHERAHRDARDQWLLGLGLVSVVVMPWNPFVWWQLRRLRQAIELDCDRRLLLAGAPASAYASLLLDLAERPGVLRMPVMALATPVSFLARRLTMLSERQPRARVIRALVAGGTAAVLFAVACETEPPTGGPTIGAVAVLEDGPPVRLSSPPLGYPPLLRRAGIEGQVVVEFVVDSTGVVDSASVEVIESSHRAFEVPAATAIRNSRFRPAVIGGKPVRLRIRQPVRFEIAPGDSTSAAGSGGVAPTARTANVVPVLAPYLVALVPDDRYPPVLAEAGIERGDVIVELAVGADGSPDLESMRIVRSSHPAFERLARETMSRRHTYSLADRDGLEDPLLLHQPLRYQLDRRLPPGRGVAHAAFKEIRARN